jgi:hypothetical protein
MGGGGKSAGVPSVAATPPPVVAAPAAPNVDSEALKAEEEKKVQRMRELDRMKRGRSATILTDADDDSSAAVQKHTLLGQKKKLGE